MRTTVQLQQAPQARQRQHARPQSGFQTRRSDRGAGVWAAAAGLVATMALGGCNMVQGVGKDISNAAANVQGALNKSVSSPSRSATTPRPASTRTRGSSIS